MHESPGQKLITSIIVFVLEIVIGTSLSVGIIFLLAKLGLY